ncbi:MAG: hypothetical protein ABI844_17415 [Saprospiraceae bacterium]
MSRKRMPVAYHLYQVDYIKRPNRFGMLDWKLKPDVKGKACRLNRLRYYKLWFIITVFGAGKNKSKNQSPCLVR